MSESFDMSQPVTRGELREELAKYPTREEADRKFDRFLGAIMRRFDERFDRFARELRADLGRDLRALEESLIARMTAMQEPYLDLPRRVTRLEAKVFPPRPARAKRR